MGKFNLLILSVLIVAATFYLSLKDSLDCDCEEYEIGEIVSFIDNFRTYDGIIDKVDETNCNFIYIETLDSTYRINQNKIFK